MDPKFAAPDELWETAVKRETALRALLQREALTSDDISGACQELAISPALLYRLLARYRKDRRTSALLPRRRGRPQGLSVLPTEVLMLIDRGIQQFYLSAQKPKVSKLQQFIAQEARKAGLRCPSRKAISNRIKSIDGRTLLRSREGAKAASDKTRPVTCSLSADFPLQIIQVDHTKIDLFVVDEKYRLPVQRPWLTLLVDVATRMVAGYHLSLEAPSSLSVALALQHSVLPKDQWLAERGISAPWPVHGLPELLHMDNGKEFHALALRRGADEYGIKLFYRPVATPHYGGHIERLIGTMMGEVHLLPGTTFSDIESRGAYDSERHAVMTLRELDQWLAIQIVGRYHHQVHRTLARPPIAMWEELASHPDVVFRHPQDKQHFYCDFLPGAERKIGREGISLFGIKYWDSVLNAWCGVSDRKFLVRYDPRDLSLIFVQSPEGSYWPIRYRDLGKPAVSLWEYQAARRQLRDQGRQEFNERMLFDAIEAQRSLIERSAAKTKSARRSRQRIVASLPLKTFREEPKIIEHQKPENSAAPVIPYDIEEWS